MKINRKYFGVLLLMGLGLLSSCGSQGADISVEDVWARPGLADGNSAVFFVIKNRSGVEDKLISASSDVAGAVELHKSSMVDGAMKMEMQNFVSVPSDGEVVFKPGDFHVMLIGLHNDLPVGEEFEVMLTFESAGVKTVNVVVREP